MSKIAIVRRNGKVDLYERHVDAVWGRVRFTPVEDVRTIAPHSDSLSPWIGFTAALLSLVAAAMPFVGVILGAMVNLSGRLA